MKIKKISIIVGTRPQIIKSQPVIESLLKEDFDVEVIHTGQHYDYELSQNFFKELNIKKPNKNLDVVHDNQLQQIANIITKLNKYFMKNRPDLVIVPGDTTSALASALVASKCRIKLAHLESGPRSKYYHMTEEVNRRLIDHCSDILFTPTKLCLKNLKRESISGKAFFVGDTMYDLFLSHHHNYDFQSLKKQRKKNILITLHRAENIDNEKKLKKICLLINKLTNGNFEVTFPIHPHTKKRIKQFKLNINANVIKPVGYFEMLRLLAKSHLVITDSGGLQKEAYWMGVPCIALQETYVWLEIIKEKANFPISLNQNVSLRQIDKILNASIKTKKSLFGGGKASKRIVKIIKELNLHKL